MSDVVNDLRNHLAGAVNLHPTVNVRAVAVYTIEQAIAEIERLRGQRDAIQAKTIALLDKLDMIEAHESFRGIWPFLHVHGYEYSGPNWKDEVAAIRALTQADKT